MSCGSSKDGAKAAEGEDWDYETEDENLQAKGDTKTDRSDDDDDFQAGRSVRPRRAAKVANASD